MKLKARLAEMAANGAGDTFPGSLYLGEEAVDGAAQVEAEQFRGGARAGRRAQADG